MNITRPVGENAHGQNANDVKIIQTALSDCKCKRYKPLYQGRIDGKCGPKTVSAIEQFQAENNIRVTGKVETYGQTINRLKQKSPGLRGMPSSSSNNSPIAKPACIGLDLDKVMKANKTLANEIRRNWPLPKREADELAKVVLRVGQELVIPLAPFGRQPVNIDNQGAFSVKFDIPYWGYNNDVPLRTQMVANVCHMVSKSPGWHKGANNNLIFKSSMTYSFLSGLNGKPSIEFIEFLGLSSPPTDPVIVASLAALEKTL